jgi:hypothetical protein
MSFEARDPKLVALESALASLAPAPGRIDRDQLLFRAGQAATPRRWLWPCATAALALLSATLSFVVLLRPEPQQITCIVYRTLPAGDAATAQSTEKLSAPGDFSMTRTAVAYHQPAPLSCIQLEQLVQRWGVDALPDPAPDSGGEVFTQHALTLDMRNGLKILELQIP